MAASTDLQQHPRGAVACLAILLLLANGSAHAGRILDYFRDFDLNDYALGVSLSVSQSPYLGAKNSTIAYPYLTSFTHSAFTDDWFLIRGENIGVRYVSKSDWEFGVVGRIQTRGVSTTDNDQLLGIEERR